MKRLFASIGGLAASAALLAVLAPKAAHAVAATLVQVTNTRSSPVPNQDVDAPGRHAYQFSCTSVGGTDSNGTVSCQLPAVPPNQELVIQNVSMVLFNATPTYPALLVSQVGGAISGNYVLLAKQGNIAYVASQPLTQYGDPGTTQTCSNTLGPNPSALLSCTVTGYFVSLP